MASKISMKELRQNLAFWTERYDVLYRGAKLYSPDSRVVERNRVRNTWEIFTDGYSYELRDEEVDVNEPMFEVAPPGTWRKPLAGAKTYEDIPF